MENLSTKTVVERYFDAFSKGDTGKVLELFHPDCLIVREGNRAKGFLSNITYLFDTRRVQVLSIMSGEDPAAYEKATA
ncbi:MAG: nuclear transport factor 2 family protein [Bacteroidota bacterium]